MVNFYVRRILAGKMTLDEVPERWKAAVKEALINEYVKKIRADEMTIDDVPEYIREDVRKALDDKGTPPEDPALAGEEESRE